MKAVIIAGGMGTRMGGLTKDIPKAMVTIGNKPLLEHQITLLRRYGIKEVLILTGHMSHVIEEYFKNGEKFGVDISYFRDKKPLSTAGSVKEVEDNLSEDFIVLYGDVMVNLNIVKLLEFHKAKNSSCTLVIHPNNHPYDSDLVEVDKEQKISGFYPKPHKENEYLRNLVNAAFYVMSAGILRDIEKGVKTDFGRDLFPKIVNKERLYGYNTPEYLKDVGTPERLFEVRDEYDSGKIERLNIENKRRAIFMDRDGVINEYVGLLNKIEDFRLNPHVSKAIRRINNSEFLAIVITNQPVIARNLCSIKELENIHKKMETLLGKENAKLDAIYYCPHHPDKGYPEENKEYKIICECRKPGIGMVKKAEKDMNIDLKGSFFIGDSSRDILCGKRAGMATIGIKRDKCNSKWETQPDFVSDNLYDAVESILD